jgi:hypothetical protein
MQNKIKHLEFVQAVINRMANNSFLLKGWAITIITALFALFVNETSYKHLLIIYLPVIIFWFLDGYFLSRERLFRAHYNHVRKLSENEIDFSMEVEKYQNNKNYSIVKSIFSKTLLSFYFPLITIMVIIIALFH